jgi:hypothetical protein
MGLFTRHPKGPVLPADIVERVVTYIEYEIDPQGSGIGSSDINRLIYQPLYRLAERDPAGFCEQLAAAVLPIGGMAAWGGERVARDLIGDGVDDPHYHAVLDAALDWLRASGASSAHLTRYEWDRWHATHRDDPW